MILYLLQSWTLIFAQMRNVVKQCFSREPAKSAYFRSAS